MDPMSTIAAVRIVPVVVLDRVEDAVPLAEALLAGGLPIMEITFRTAAAAGALAKVAELPLVAGAGTVVTPDQVDEAVAAGATFLVSPGTNEAVIERAKTHGVPILPGVADPSDIMRALALDIDVVKFFPANILGGSAAIRALAAPFPTVRFVPTGGISQDNLADYFAVPAVLAIGGSWMVDRALVEAGDWPEITRRASAAVKSAKV